MKKRYKGALFAALSCIFLIGCGSGEKEKVEVIVKIPTLTLITANDSEVTEGYQFLEKAADAFSEQYEDAEVEVKVECFPIEEEDANIRDNYDTEDAADVLFEGFFNMSSYIHSGRLVPLDDIISDELRADFDENSLSLGQINGKTYMMPYYGLENVVSYNKDLFREAGLEEYISDEDVIGNWTLEEWDIILETLHENLPENCYPMMMYAKNDQGDTHVMTLIRSHGSSFFDEDGYVNLSTEEGIAGLTWLKDNYDSGYYPTACENMEILDMTTLYSRGQLAIYMTNSTLMHNFTDIDQGYVNFPSADGEGLSTTFVSGFGVFDNGDEEKLKASKAFVQFIYENEEWLDYSTGGIPCCESVMERYSDDIFMLEEFYNNKKNVVNFTANNPNWRGVRQVFYPCIQELLTGEKTPEEVAAELDEKCNAAISEGWSSSKLHE